MEKHIIKRDGLPPIAFEGEMIGSGSTETHNSNRWTTVGIYRTKGGRYIVHEAYRTQWEGESDRNTATSCENAEAVIDWLRSRTDGDGLGSASQEAVEEAVKADSAFAAAWVEEVE